MVNKRKREYAKKNYKYITFKLKLDDDKGLIDYLESLGGNRSEYLRDILNKEFEEKVNGGKYNYYLKHGESYSNDEEVDFKGTYVECKAKFPTKQQLKDEMRTEYYSSTRGTYNMHDSFYYKIERVLATVDEDGDETEDTNTIEILDYISMTFDEALV